jgi:ATP-dependent exoDNAse (exonuclease V) beta subunit
MTRARETLVIADDAALFDKTQKSFAELLGVIDGPRAGTFRGWPEELFPRIGKSARKTSKDWKSVPAAKPDPAAASVRSGKFMRRVLPSSLAVHAGGETEPERRLDADPDWGTAANEAARAYGTWWHETVERIDWHADRLEWQKIVDARVLTCPQPERAEREWGLFLTSEMPGRLALAGTLIHAEMPFLFARDGNECLEGVIDLAVFDPARRDWFVIDWKTNLVDATNASTLRDIYAPQVRAYAEALTRVTGCPAACAVYSTAAGTLLPC